MDAAAEIKTLYYNTTQSTIDRDLARAIALLKSMPDDEARARVSVYMEGLVEMRGEWAQDRTPRRR